MLIFLMWAHTRGLQLAFIGRSDRELVKEGLDAFHSAIFQDMADNGTPEAQLPLFEQRVGARYAEYYSAAGRSDSELGVSVARHLAGSEQSPTSLADALTERAIEVANPLRDFLEEVEPLLKKPWVKLVDLRGWRTSYPQMVNVIGDHLKWCKAHNMGLSLNVLNNPSTFRQLNEMFRHAGTREMSETFRTMEEAEKFVKANWLDLEVKDRLVKKR